MMGILLSVLAMTLLSLTVIYVYKRHQYRIRIKMMKINHDFLLNEIEKEKRKRKEVESKLNALITDKQKNVNDNITEDIMIDKNEVLFRKRFEVLYPWFIRKLREYSTSLSNRDEIMCMLIAIGQNSFQIENILGIAHRSVIVSRYRLKQKLNMDINTNMDEFLKDMITKPDEN